MFYSRLPEIHDLSEITNPDCYADVPPEWHIALTDVRGSTQAIENGQYRDVNAIAAASITALLNDIPEVELPFVFGGDGATVLIPPEAVQRAEGALLATRQLAQTAFKLDLRVGIVPVRDVLAGGARLRVAKLHVSENFRQAVFTGGGLAYAESLVKDETYGDRYAVTASGDDFEADFSGFECRWREVESQHDETISLLVTAQSEQTYADVLEFINNVYGDRMTRHPITIDNLKLAIAPVAFRRESAIRYRETGLLRLLKIMWINLKGIYAMRFNVGRWGSYKNLLVNSTDHEKFDDALRMTISGTAKQREMLQLFLENRRLRGELVYGIHVAQRALVTCLIFDHFGKQVHFVDSANGGYALAAKQMKAQRIPV